MSKVDFIKYEGLGNDFVLVDDTNDPRDFGARAVARICDRHFGVGADGLILVRPSENAEARMCFYNPDGSEAEMCGNGIRAFAKYLFDSALVQATSFRVETGGGLKTVSVILDGRSVSAARVDMGTPSFKSNDVPALVPTVEAVDVPIDLGDWSTTATCVSMGNPHCVVFVDDAQGAMVDEVGPRIETLPIFPQRTNVEFAEVTGPGDIRLRVWERGAGETLACGTGACAAAAAAARTGRTGRRVVVHLPGGDLEISWEADDRLFMTGPVSEVFRGAFEVESLAAPGPTEPIVRSDSTP